MLITDKCTILTGVAGQGDVALITVMNDGLAEQRRQHSVPLIYWRGTWRPAGDEKVLPWLAAGSASTKNHPTRFLIVGWAGEVLLVEDQQSRREAIRRKDDFVSIVRSIATIDSVVYTAGMRRQVHRRFEDGRWEEIDDGVAYHGDEPIIGFNAIDGFDTDEIYAVGLNGEIWCRDHGQWQEVDSPTNVHLHSICCAPNGQVYVGGRSGLLIRGKRDTWDVLDLGEEETIWDVQWLGDQLYILFNDGVYVGEGDEFHRVENDVFGDGNFHRFSATEGKLWVFGEKRIVRFDGESWNEIDCVLSESVNDADILAFFNDDVILKGSAYLDDDE